MDEIPLYRYPFDNEGRKLLTLEELLAALRNLDCELNTLLIQDWRWCDVRLTIVERHPTYCVYEVEHHGELKGRAVVNPFAPESTVNDRALQNKIRFRGKPKRT